MNRWWRDWSRRFKGWWAARTSGLRRLWTENFGKSDEIFVNEERLDVGDISFWP